MDSYSANYPGSDSPVKTPALTNLEPYAELHNGLVFPYAYLEIFYNAWGLLIFLVPQPCQSSFHTALNTHTL
jgi:hypothetical protein